MLSQQEREGMIVCSASPGGSLGLLMYISGSDQITLNQSPHNSEDALTRGYPPVASSAGVNKNVSNFFTRKHSAMTKVGTS